MSLKQSPTRLHHILNFWERQRSDNSTVCELCNLCSPQTSTCSAAILASEVHDLFVNATWRIVISAYRARKNNIRDDEVI